MRTYKAKIKMKDDWKIQNTGLLGEKIFNLWFNSNYETEKLFKQCADRDYEGIDFADEKGYTYQVKATRARSYTFNCYLDDLNEHLRSDIYVFIQIHEKYAYIESLYNKNEILNLARQSFKKEKSCFVYAKDLLQQKLF